jgi:hypothetical protein
LATAFAFEGITDLASLRGATAAMNSEIAEFNLDVEEVVESWIDSTLSQMRRAVIMIEVLGSVQSLDRLGFFRGNELLRETTYRATPTNRGGECDTVEGMVEYERMVDAIVEECGREVFDSIREQVEQVLAEVEAAEAEAEADDDSPKQ